MEDLKTLKANFDKAEYELNDHLAYYDKLENMLNDARDKRSELYSARNRAEGRYNRANDAPVEFKDYL